MTRKILKLTAVKAEVAKSRSQIYLDIRRGLFPRQVPLGTRAVGWPAQEVADVNAARIAGKSEDEIRTIVARMHERRKFALVEVGGVDAT